METQMRGRRIMTIAARAQANASEVYVVVVFGASRSAPRSFSLRRAQATGFAQFTSG
jgi:hypothetical protein